MTAGRGGGGGGEGRIAYVMYVVRNALKEQSARPLFTMAKESLDGLRKSRRSKLIVRGEQRVHCNGGALVQVAATVPASESDEST